MFGLFKKNKVEQAPDTSVGDKILDDNELLDIWRELEDGFQVGNVSHAKGDRSIVRWWVSFKVLKPQDGLGDEIERLVKFTESLLGLKLRSIRVTGYTKQYAYENLDITPIGWNWSVKSKYRHLDLKKSHHSLSGALDQCIDFLLLDRNLYLGFY